MSKLQWALATAAVAGLLAWSAVPPANVAVDAPPAHRVVAVNEPRNSVVLSTEPRGLPPRARDLFTTPPPPPPQKSAPVPQLVEAPKAPPLPYKYDGSGVVQGKTFVYLKRQDRSFMVSPGDTLEGMYSVEAVERDHAVLRYLPLGTRQVMMYQAGAEVPPGLVAAASPSRPLEMQVDMPTEVLLGQEFVVSIVLPGAGALKATLEVGYDPEVLTMVGAGLPRPGGRAVIEVARGSTPRAQLHFKVLADSPASTDIDLQVNATDAAGKRVPVWSPKAHTVSLVQPGA